jgi:predicted RNA-binding protein with PUA-like domain
VRDNSRRSREDYMVKTQHWLVKSEPDAYSIDDLARDGRTCWDGVRNYQARNFMRDSMRIGDGVLFYHSSVEPAGVVGVARVCSAAYADHTALDKKNAHFDPKSTGDEPIWMMVDIEFVEKFPRVVGLAELKREKSLSGMPLLQRGQRLSVMPVSPEHFKVVLKLAKSAAR